MLTSRKVEAVGSTSSARAATATFSLTSPPFPSRSSIPERRRNTSAPSVSDAEATRVANTPASPTARAAVAAPAAVSSAPSRTGVRVGIQMRGRLGTVRQPPHHPSARRDEPAGGTAPAKRRPGAREPRRPGACAGRRGRSSRSRPSRARPPCAAQPTRRARRAASRPPTRARFGPDSRPGARRLRPRSGRSRRAPSRARAGSRRARTPGCRDRLPRIAATGRTAQPTYADAAGAASRATGAREPPRAGWTGRDEPLQAWSGVRRRPGAPTARRARARRETRPRAPARLRTDPARGDAPRP